MTERFASDLVFILVVLVVAALLGFIIGYLVKRYQCLRRCSELEDEIAKQKNLLSECEREKQTLRAELDSMINVPFDAKAASDAMGVKVTENDLVIIEGIGEKIASILKGRGIDTWLKLSKTDAAKIKEILLEVGGSQYNVHEPRTWPGQALLAAQGKWGELKKYQDELNAGK